MTPVVPTTVQRTWWATMDCMAPERMRNSPTKPLSMGRPTSDERRDDEDRDHPGQLGGEAAVVAHVVGAVALVEEAEEDEEGGAGDGFVEDLVDAAVEARDGEGEDAEDDEADVRRGWRRRRGCLRSFCDQRDERAVDDADGAERDHERGDVAGLSGKMPKLKRRME